MRASAYYLLLFNTKDNKGNPIFQLHPARNTLTYATSYSYIYITPGVKYQSY